MSFTRVYNMYVYLLDELFRKVEVIDVFESLIWTDRYREHGDFELFTYPTKQLLEKAKDNMYLQNPMSEHTMIIEAQRIQSDVENGNRLIITGRSLESILKRRIVMTVTTLEGNLQDCVERLLNENCIKPKDTKRKIPDFVFKRSTDPRINDLTFDGQFFGVNLYDAIQTICEEPDLGFKIVLNDTKFEFSLYKGEDRSYNQVKNPYVVFSPNFENIVESNYLHSVEDYSNTAIVSGETERYGETTITVGDTQGLLRREIYSNAMDISDKLEDGSVVSKDAYIKLLTQRGAEDLKDFKLKNMFDGRVETSRSYSYGVDFSMGDLVQLENEYGMGGTSKVTEIIWTQDENGENTFPTFVSTDKEDTI